LRAVLQLFWTLGRAVPGGLGVGRKEIFHFFLNDVGVEGSAMPIPLRHPERA